MSRWKLRAAVVLVAAATVLAPAVPAGATGQWDRMACSSGAIDAITVTDRRLELRGHLDCARQSNAATFGVATYGPDGAGVYQASLRAYGSQAPTSFSFANQVQSGYRQFALCVVTDYHVRVGCVSVSVNGSEAPIVAVPLSIDDPLVSAVRPDIIRVSKGSDPACGGCW